MYSFYIHSLYILSLGEVNITSGRSERSSSGIIKIGSPSAGSKEGTSGSIKMTTGFSRKADSGSISIQTGDTIETSSYDTQNSGNITMSIGSSQEGNGGSVMINAGSSYSRQPCKQFIINIVGLGINEPHSPLHFLCPPKQLKVEVSNLKPGMLGLTTTLTNYQG